MRSFVADAGGYLGYFLQRRDLPGFVAWARAFGTGLRGKGFGPLEDQKF